jgi:hypothetical protein
MTDITSLAPQSSFQERLKTHQIAWAVSNDLAGKTETANGRPWVLKREYQTDNLFEPIWWTYIAGKEHRWARALNSSQCFAVNLFAPLIENQVVAKAVYARLLPDRPLERDDEIAVELEYSPAGARKWLGERGQQTQIDAAFSVIRRGKAVGHLLIEVKLGEATFGTCRGSTSIDKSGRGNPHPGRCRDLAAILATPDETCWLAATEGRRYWAYMMSPETPFDFSAMDAGASCPFAGGLYQPMRNRVLADALVAETDAIWADCAVTVHPDNDVAHILGEEVVGETDAVAAFRRLVGSKGVCVIGPTDFLNAVCGSDVGLSDWAEWVRGRYMLDDGVGLLG